MAGALAAGLLRRGVLRPASAATSTPTLDTATAYWICKNNSTYYDSTNDRLIDKSSGGGRHLRRGTAVGSDSGDPTFGDDGTYEHLSFDGTNDFLVNVGSPLTVTGEFTMLIVAKRVSSSNTQMLFSTRDGFATSDPGVDLIYRVDLSCTGIQARVCNGSSLVDVGCPGGIAWTTSSINVLAVKRDGANSVTAHVEGSSLTSGTLSGTVTGDVNLHVASRNAAALWAGMTVNGAAVWIGDSSINLSTAKSEILSLATL